MALITLDGPGELTRVGAVGHGRECGIDDVKAVGGDYAIPPDCTSIKVALYANIVAGRAAPKLDEVTLLFLPYGGRFMGYDTM